jgi:hypothetical protein
VTALATASACCVVASIAAASALIERGQDRSSVGAGESQNRARESGQLAGAQEQRLDLLTQIVEQAL